MADRDLPSPEYLRQRLRYDPETGKLYWRRGTKRRHAHLDGREAFTALRNTGYKHGRIDDVAYQAHRAIWAMEHGAWPDGQVDHIDHDRTNNRLANLRVVSHQENHRNTSLRKNNTSGAMGVSWYKAGGKWTAYIMVDGRKTHLGYFTDISDAVAARKAAEAKYGFHANHGVEAPASA